MNKIIVFLTLLTLAGFISCYDTLGDSYDSSKLYNLRERGPAGGWIFYINPNYRQDGWRYLEAAPDDQSSAAPWTLTASSWTLASGTAVGTGRSNTTAIVNSSSGGAGTYAANLCYNLDSGGYNDWFLPSSDELDLMYTNLKATYNLANFAPAVYWSSKETNAAGACRKDFNTGAAMSCSQLKTSNSYVRAIRAF